MSIPGAPAARRVPEAAGHAAMLGATLVWGATFVVIRDSLHSLDPVALVFLRFALATALLAIVAIARRARIDRAALTGGALGGACAAGGYLFQAIGLTSTSAGSSAFLTCTGTLFAAFFAWPLLAQRPAPSLLLGIALAMLGSMLLRWEGGLTLGAGEAWTLLGAVSFALQIVVLAKHAPGADPLALTLVQAAVLALLLSPSAPHAVRALPGLSGTDLLRLGYLTVAGSALAPFLQVLAQRTLPAGRIGLLFALEPVFALGFAVTIGGERFAQTWWLGAAMILSGVIGVEIRAAHHAARR